MVPIRIGNRPNSQAYGPPASILSLYQIGMSFSLYPAVASGDRLHLSVFGSAFGNYEVVLTIDFVKVRRFRVGPSRTFPNQTSFGQHAAGFDIDFALINAGTLLAGSRGLKIHASVIIE